MIVLSEPQWQQRIRAHTERVDRLTRDHLDRRSRGLKHPVWDFMFDYYSYRPGEMRTWHPGLDVRLQGSPPHADWRWYSTSSEGTSLALEELSARRRHAWMFIRDLLDREQKAPAHFDCFGLHEWAMVYQSEQPRHDLPLRLGASGTNRVVDEHSPLRCTHYDAFRFYTPAARPLNIRPLSRSDQLSCEQNGCLHATMDLYKWAYKLAPLVPSELIIDAFELACQARVLDMEASPYDCRSLGFGVVPIETRDGKAEYVARQREIVTRAEPIRARLQSYVDRALTITLNE